MYVQNNAIHAGAHGWRYVHIFRNNIYEGECWSLRKSSLLLWWIENQRYSTVDGHCEFFLKSLTLTLTLILNLTLNKGIKPSTGIVNSALRASMKLGNWEKFSDIKLMLSLFNRTKIPKECLLQVSPSMVLKSLKECSELLLLSQTEEDVSHAIHKVSGESSSGSDTPGMLQ